MPRTTLQLGQLRVRIHTLSGTGGPTYVLVHGIGVSSAYFEPLAHRLHQHGDVLLIDLPGFGGLPQPSNPLSISGFAHTIERVMAARQVTDPVFVGHSMGGQVVTELAARLQTTSPVVLIGPPVNAAEPTLHQQALRFAQSSWRESARTSLIALQSYTQCGPAWFIEVLPRMLRYPITERIGRLRARVLLIRGEHDRVAPLRWLKLLAEHCADARLATIDGASHAVVYEHAEQTATLILGHAGSR